MNDCCKKILQQLDIFFSMNPNSDTGDKEVSQALRINRDKVRSCFKDLSQKEYIFMEVIPKFDSNNKERLIVSGLTYKGWQFINEY